MQFLQRATVVAKAIADESLDANSLAANLRQGQWSRAVSSFANSEASSFSAEELLSLIFGILAVPVCYVDHFVIAAVGRAAAAEGESALSVAFMPPSNPDKPAVEFAARNRTRGALQRLCTYGVMKWHDHPRVFDLGFENREVRERFQRYTHTLAFLSKNPQAYGEVMTLVKSEAWAKAEERAAALLSAAGISDMPPGAPALADFLIVALTPFRTTPQLANRLFGSV